MFYLPPVKILLSFGHFILRNSPKCPQVIIINNGKIKYKLKYLNSYQITKMLLIKQGESILVLNYSIIIGPY